MDGNGLSDGDSGESMVENFASKSTECEGVLNARYGLSACHAVHTSSPRFHPHGRTGLYIAYTNYLVPSLSSCTFLQTSLLSPSTLSP